jgi:mycothiol synthase
VISEIRAGLDSAQIDAVLAVARAATEADGVAPLSEETLLSLEHQKDVVHLLAQVDGVIAGYAQLSGIAEDVSAEVVVHPEYRGRGLGHELVEAAFRLAPQLAIWVHGDQPSALALASKLGLRRSRVLFRMCRPLVDKPLPPVRLPDGVAIRAFVPGRDEAAWLKVNSAAFATHPEQGKWEMKDILLREAEDWFDPAGFLLAVRSDDPDALLGFHWTKRHSPEVGEVYVVGVAPEAQGLRLGKALTIAGLAYLAEGGSREGILYVDESNPRAVRLYSELGFQICETHVMYSR